MRVLLDDMVFRTLGRELVERDPKLSSTTPSATYYAVHGAEALR
jgi:hypothetical protein